MAKDSRKVLSEEAIRAEEATEEVQDLLDRVTLDAAFDRTLWPSLMGIAQVIPGGLWRVAQDAGRTLDGIEHEGRKRTSRRWQACAAERR